MLRRFTEADADLLVALDADPDVMRFLGNGSPTPPEMIIDEVLPAILRRYERFPGFGHWAALERSSGAFLGWFEFRPPEEAADPESVELGYRLHRRPGAGATPPRARTR
ncbi:GNAT family N-acetyltransferase [Streptomyces sp. 8N616]|uniref:GNAT family N-acetyltransferase n=1 Tax=Streptomyces sp. 8N616 TaxID=3457414 RepID=UPI003FD65FF2